MTKKYLDFGLRGAYRAQCPHGAWLLEFRDGNWVFYDSRPGHAEMFRLFAGAVFADSEREVAKC